MFTRPYIYAETAFHHEGDFEFLLELIRSAAGTGVQGIKFQVLLEPESLFSIRHSSFAKINEWVFSEKQWLRASELATEMNLDIIWMPLDLSAVDLVDKLSFPIKYLELHSVSFFDQLLNQRIKLSKLPLIIGTGGRTVEEIDEKIKFYEGQVKILMMGFQSFPTNILDVKLKRISKYCSMYPELILGYADHSSHESEFSVISNEYAYLLGATIFEKHFTTNEGVQRTDFEAAIGIEKLILITKRLNLLYDIISINQSDNTILKMNDSEIVYRNRQKVWTSSMDIEAGTILEEAHITLKMIDQIDGLTDKSLFIGKTAVKEIKRGQLITTDLVK